MMNVRNLLFFFFSVIGIAGLTHGFPLIDLFADEMYFVYGPLSALQQKTLLPIGVPYGTITFYANLLLQGIFLSVMTIFSGFDIDAVKLLIMQYPFLVYIPPRVLSLILFLGIVYLTTRKLRIETVEEVPYTTSLLLILLGNITLLTFMHSGKMWITCIFFLFLTGIYLQKSPKKSMLSAALGFANLPLMGMFLGITYIFQIYNTRGSGKRIIILTTIALIIPLLFFSLNVKEITSQIHSVLFSYMFPETQTAEIGTRIILYIQTFGAYLIKLILTAPFTLILCGLAVFSRAHVKEKSLFVFSIISLCAYIAVISMMTWSADIPGYLRYLLPFHILFLLFFLSIRFQRTRINTIMIRTMSVLSVYLMIISTITLIRPTTFEQTRQTVMEQFNTKQTIVLSNVPEVSFPINTNAATLMKQYTPGRCGYRCRFALEQNVETVFKGTELPIKTDEIGMRQFAANIAKERQADIILLIRDDSEHGRTVEHGFGNYLTLKAWIPETLGPKIIVEEWENNK